jgi:Tol biopolymer transport system component
VSTRRTWFAILLALGGIVFAAVLFFALGAIETSQPSNVEPGGQAGTPPTPSPPLSPAQAGETTLIEVATGRVYQWPEGSNVQNARFSPDSRWLTYNAGWLPGDNRGPPDASVYRMDLLAAELAPERLSSGFNPVMSSRGDTAYVAEMDRQIANVYVRTAAGDVHKLPLAGSTFLAPIWTPDGRHLIYAGGSNTPGQGTTEGIPVMVANAGSWTSRIVDRVRVDSHGPYIQLSPDGRYLYYSDHLVSVADGAVERVVVAGWLDAGHYLVQERSATVRGSAELYSIDVNTGVRRHLGRTVGNSWNAALGLSVENVNEQVGPGTPAPAFDEYTRIMRFDGSVVIDRLRGFFRDWSPDNRYFTTGGADSKCETTVYEVNGREVACFDGWLTSWGNDKLAVLRVTDNGNAATKTAIGDVYIVDLATGTERIVLQDMRSGTGYPCLRWSPDGRWLLTDDYCDTM